MLEKIPSPVRWAFTIFVVGIGWIVFKAPDSASFCTYISNMLGSSSADNIEYTWKYFLSEKVMILSAVSIIGMTIAHFEKIQNLVERWNNSSIAFNIVKYLLLVFIFSLEISGVTSSSFNPFIYFQF